MTVPPCPRYATVNARVTLPLSEPKTCGVKARLQVMLSPLLRVAGRLSPLTVKFGPDEVACVIWTVALPGLVRLTACVWVDRTGTVPKLIEEGVSVRCSPELAPDLAADAGEVSATIREKKKRKDEQSPEIPDRFEPKLFTTRPHNAVQQVRGRGMRSRCVPVKYLVATLGRNPATAVCG